MSSAQTDMGVARPRDVFRQDYVRQAEELPQPERMILLKDPQGTVFDVSSRVERISSLRETTEEDLQELTHGDVTLRIKTEDGALERWFQAAEPGQRWEVEILREKVHRSRVVWESLFGGVLDLPWSLQFTYPERRATVRAFAYSKELELGDAELIIRTLALTEGTSVAASKDVTLDDTDEIQPLDELTLEDSFDSETQVVAYVISSTVVRCQAAWAKTFDVAAARIDTPYRRHQRTRDLAEDLFTQAGVDLQLVRLQDRRSEHPFPSPVNLAAADQDAKPGGDGGATAMDLPAIVPASITSLEPLPSGGNYIRVRVSTTGGEDASQHGEWQIRRASSGWWKSVTPGSDTLYDWTPYKATPTLYGGGTDDPDTGSLPNEDGASRGTARDCMDYATSDEWRWGRASGNIKIVKNQANVGNWESEGNNNSYSGFVEYVPTAGGAPARKIWYSRAAVNAIPWFGSHQRRILTYDDSSVATVTNAMGGALRYLRKIDRVAVHEIRDGSSNAFTTNLRLYDPAAFTEDVVIQVPQGLLVWTLRVTDDYVAGIYRSQDTWRLRVWSWTSNPVIAWTQVADYVLGASTAMDTDHPLLTVLDNSETGESEFWGYAGSGIWFVASVRPSGVISYVNTEGMNVSQALVELATANMAYFTVSPDRVGIFQTRDYNDLAALPAVTELDTPLTRTTWPLWEFYREQVKLSGTTPGGTSFEVLAGSGASRGRLFEASSAFLQSEGYAAWLAQLYLAFFSSIRGQEQVTVREVGELAHILDVRRLDGRAWLVVDAMLREARREQGLRLVEVI